MKIKKTAHVLLFLVIGLASENCKKDNNDVKAPSNPNQKELITTVGISAVDSISVNNLVSAQWKSLTDNDKPDVDTIILKPNTTYFGQLLLLDESKSPVDTISHEVAEEGNEHQVFYDLQAGNASIETMDVDDNDVPVGVKFKIKAGVSSVGTLRIVLKHQGEDKPKSGSGNQAIGATDIDVTFPVKVK